MLKKRVDFLSGWPMTLVGGAFLLASFILPRVGYPAGEKLAWVCVVICGIPLVYLSVRRIIHNKGIAKISSALLISIAMIAAILIGDLFAAGEVAFIMQIGALLEDMTTERAKKGLKNLIALAPQTGRVIQDGRERTVAVEQIRVGDTVRVLPGETIPVDGVIRTGETSVDQSVMTGESLPVDKAVGDSVFSGTINRFGAIDIEVTKVSGDSALQKLIRMVEDAENHQASTQRIADRWASWLVPIALIIALLAWLVTGDIVRGVTVMVVFCPCALVLATPTAIMAAIGQATKHGVIIKSGEALERMGGVDTIAFDKTGTLTCGRLAVSDVLPMTDMTPDALLVLAASAERLSEHPLGKAIAERAKGIPLMPVCDFKMQAGKGIQATMDGRAYRLGSEKFIAQAGVQLDGPARAALEKLRGEGKASVIVADETRVVGIIALSDVLRPEAADVVRRLADMNTRAVLLTGDHATAARFFASKVGITDVRADLLPEDKVQMVAELKRRGTVCMVGDGVNDAPALKTADVGVAMGAMGSDIAVDAADVALMTDDISRLPYLKWLSNATVKTIRKAIALSMCINFVAVTLSVLGVLNPTTGALVHNAGSCFVVLLAVLLYDRKYEGMRSIERTD
ncbi:MAG: cation-translocating P-type ATPase [Clostridia bacterium]|nr:cation-translocating P-type ATPase [Clostridia bacterium]